MAEILLSELRCKVIRTMSEKRANHTLEVEKMARRLAKLYCPALEEKLSAAALLHDVTKEYSPDKQVILALKMGIELSEIDLATPKTLHARTAAAIIPLEYPDFADDEIISAVRWHTTGRAGMTIAEKIIYLADYIDMSRSFEDCVRLREYFFGADPENMNGEERLLHLDKTLLMSYDMTLRGLIEDKKPISDDTMAARNELCIRLKGKI